MTFDINEEKKYSDLRNNAILPEFQSHGIGKMQYNKVLDIFIEKSLNYAMVTTGYDDNEKARASYEKVGFKKVKSSIKYFQKL